MVIYAAVFGGATSAFLPRIASRLAIPRGAAPPATCPKCANQNQAWVRVGPSCGCESVPWRPVTAGAGAAALLGVPVLLPAVVLGVLLSMIDIRCLRLPDPLVGLLALLTMVPLSLLAEPGQLVRGALAAGISFTAYAMVAILPGGGLGFGDVKLAAVLGFVLGCYGWQAVVIGLIGPHLINGPIALYLLLRGRAGRRTALPFGPALLVGALLGVAFG